MTVWRMAMRLGDGGANLYPKCVQHGVAGITYFALRNTDLSKYPEGEPRRLWDQLAASQKASLAAVAYKMKPGDIIYIKDGTSIVCRGKVTGRYQFDRKGKIVTVGNEHCPFSHQVPVEWETDFLPVTILLGAEPTTVLKLTGERLQRLEEAVRQAKNNTVPQGTTQDKTLEAMEGHAYRAESLFRKRNRALIEAKKLDSDGRCSVCALKFSERYRGIGNDCLVAHHVEPIGVRKKASKTRLDDIELLCPNCHAAVHTEDPPLTAQELRKRLVEC